MKKINCFALFLQ